MKHFVRKRENKEPESNNADTKDQKIQKHPELDASFWILKEIATTLGETGGDWVTITLHLGFQNGAILFLCLFVGSLIFQLLINKHIPALYWFVMLSSSCLGTTFADFLSRTLQLGYMNSFGILVLFMVLLLVCWRLLVGNINVNNIHTMKAEILYWIIIWISNTIGTEFGDYLSHDTDLGFAGSLLVVCAILLVIILLHVFTKLHKTVVFWLAFVFSRPFGILIGDCFTHRPPFGMGLGYGYTSLVLLILLIIGMVLVHFKVKIKNACEKSKLFSCKICCCRKNETSV